VDRRLLVFRGRWVDSVLLMKLARDLEDEPGVRQAAAVMATDANRALLADLGWDAGGLGAAGPNDLVVAAAGEEPGVSAALAGTEELLARRRGAGAAAQRGPVPRTIAEAAALAPGAGVAVISVPGAHAAREARAALEADLNVFLFSSNVSLEEEIGLKRDAAAKGLVVMGPDCGTALISGIGIGFANAVCRGPIGAIGPSGTGLQEFTSLVHRAGCGISHAIGTGSRDLSDAVGGITTFAAIEALEGDAATAVIAIVGKPPGTATLARLRERLALCAKPAVLCLIGTRSDAGGDGAPTSPRTVPTIDEAVAEACALAGAARPASAPDAAAIRARAASETAGMAPAQRYLRGLFSGGTFCYQAQAVMRDGGLMVHADSPIPGMLALADPRRSVEHSLVDMGAETFVEGRAHPMIDAAQRRSRIFEEAADPSVAVLLLDFVLGAIASPTPVQDLLDAVVQARAAAASRGGRLCVVASVCGTELDGQDLALQERLLAEAGVVLLPSAARAAAFAREATLLRSGR
jgi:FdrA protein